MFLSVQSIVSAIPRGWKALLRQNPNATLGVEDREAFFSINEDTQIRLTMLQSRHVYHRLIVKRRPTAEQKWRDEGVQVHNWRDIYRIPYKCSTSTRIQSLHYRIVHRYIPTRKFLSTRGVVGSPLCLKCLRIDTLQHFFCECDDTRPIWDTITHQLSDIFAVQINTTQYQKILLGLPNAPPIVNLVMLLLKEYIVRCKLSQLDRLHEPRVENFKQIILNHWRAELLIAKKNDKTEAHTKKWRDLFDANNNLLLC